MPSIQKRGDTYRIMVSLGYDMDGRQIRKTTTFTPPPGVTEGKGEKLATAYAYEFEKHCQGMTNMNENLRFSELCDWYFNEIAVHKLKQSTYENNLLMINLYVLPYIGNLKLKDVTTARIDALFNQLHRDGRTTETYKLKDTNTLGYGVRRPLSRKSGVNMNTLRTLADGGTVVRDTAERIAAAMGCRIKELFTVEQVGGGLSSGSIQRVRSALSPIFSTAVKKELLLKNPVFNATTPKDPEKKEHPFLDAEQCKELMGYLDEFTNPQMPRIIKTLMYTGMRVGELAGLLWENVYLDKAMLVVKYNCYRSSKDKAYKLDTPKTKTSNRVIALPPQIVELLQEQKEWQEQRKADVGDRWIERGAVFTGEYGEFINKNYVNLSFKRLLEKHPDFPQIHIHDLRHANASLLINSGVPVKVISEHLGHSDTRTTEKIYAHVFAETMVQASDAISKALATV